MCFHSGAQAEGAAASSGISIPDEGAAAPSGISIPDQYRGARE